MGEGEKIMSFDEDYGLDMDTGEWLSINALQPTDQRNPNKQTPHHFVNTSAQVDGWFLLLILMLKGYVRERRVD